MDDLSLGDLLCRHRGQGLSPACRRCGWTAAPPLAVLAAELGAGTTLAEGVARLGCPGCGSRPAMLGLSKAAPRKRAASAAAA
jgi:hypothetical protein